MEQVVTQESQGNSGTAGKTYCALDGRNTLEAVRKRHIEVVLHATEHDLGEAAWILQVSVPELRRLITRLEVRMGKACVNREAKGISSCQVAP